MKKLLLILAFLGFAFAGEKLTLPETQTIQKLDLFLKECNKRAVMQQKGFEFYCESIAISILNQFVSNDFRNKGTTKDYLEVQTRLNRYVYENYPAIKDFYLANKFNTIKGLKDKWSPDTDDKAVCYAYDRLKKEGESYTNICYSVVDSLITFGVANNDRIDIKDFYTEEVVEKHIVEKICARK